MTTVSLTRIIAALPEDVFVFFVPLRMPFWYGREMDSSFEANGAPNFTIGAKVYISGRLGQRSVAHTALVTAFERGRLLEWSFGDEFGVRGRERWELHRTQNSAPTSSRVQFLCEFETPGRLGRLMDWLLTRH